jgi:hypothetical protein
MATSSTKKLPEIKPVALVEKAVKVKPPKLVRDGFTMPKPEYAQIAMLKSRSEKLGKPAKKSELLRAGVMALTAMSDTAFKAVLGKVPPVKTGRPKKVK